MFSRPFSKLKLAELTNIRCSFVTIFQRFKSTRAFEKSNYSKSKPQNQFASYRSIICGKIRTHFSKASQQFRHAPQSSKYPVVFSCAVIGTYGMVYSINNFLPSTTWETITNALTSSVKAIHPAANNFIADVVDKTGPAVALLEIKRKNPTTGNPYTISNGSGFLVRPNGLILTSAHVINNVASSARVMVKLYDGESYKGQITAIDQAADLAAIKIEPKDDQPLPYISLESSDKVRAGEFVVAMGSPLALSKTVTSGIVSSKQRKGKEIGRPFDRMEYIQTDAFIYFGNSGGPLVNLDGEAIGINNLRLKSGISFAIPADYAVSFLNEVDRAMERKSHKPKNKPRRVSNIIMGQEVSSNGRFVGMTMLSLTPPLIEELKETIPGFQSVEHGVYVHTVLVASPAYDAGLHAGDIIVEVNGNKIYSAADIYKIVEGDPRLHTTIVRGNSRRKLEIITDELF